MKNRMTTYLCAAGLLLFFAVFLFLPLYTVLEQGLDGAVLAEVLRNRLYLDGLKNAFAISVVTTFFVFLMALPLAVLYDKYEFPGKSLCPVLMMAPMILPPFVGALGFQQLLSHYGVLNSILVSLWGESARVDFLGGDGRFWSICLMEALHLYPILYLNLITSLANIDPNLHAAARNLGISPVQRFFRITLPLLRPGIFAGGSIVLIWSFTELGTPLMFGWQTVTPVQIFNGITELGTNPAAYSLVIIMLLASSILYLTGRLLLGNGGSALTVKGMTGSRAEPLSGAKRFCPVAVFLGFTFIAVLPHLTLILTAGSVSWYNTILPLQYSLIHFKEALSNALVVPSIENSLEYSLIATVIACTAGLATAWLTKRSRLKSAGLFDLIAMLPLMIPGLVIAVGFLGMSIRYSWVQTFLDPVSNPVLLIAAAYAIRRVPYVLRAASSGLEQTPEDLELAARNAGSSPIAAFLKITLPLILANLVVGALFAFSFSMLEVSDSLILAQKSEFFPITKAIYELSTYLGNGPCIAAAFGVWAMFFLASTLAAAGILLGRKIGSVFKL